MSHSRSTVPLVGDRAAVAEPVLAAVAPVSTVLRPGDAAPAPECADSEGLESAPGTSSSAAFTLLFLLVLVGPSWADRAAEEGVRAPSVRIERCLERARTRSTARLQPLRLCAGLTNGSVESPQSVAAPQRLVAAERFVLPQPRAPDGRV